MRLCKGPFSLQTLVINPTSIRYGPVAESSIENSFYYQDVDEAPS